MGDKRYTKNKDQRHISLPFINGLTQPLQHLYNKFDLKIAHKAHNLLSRNFSRLKTKTSENKKSNIVYEIPCGDCDGVYIGQTSQYLENRVKGHKYDKNNATALSKHEENKKHSFNYNNIKVIATEQNTKKRELLESILIYKNTGAINDKKDINNLNKIYYSVL